MQDRGNGHSRRNGLGIGKSSQIDGKEQIEHAIDVLYRRKWLVVACLLVGIAVAVGLTLRQQPVFQASSYIMVDLGRASSPSVADVTADQTSFFASNDRAMSDELFVLHNSYQLAHRVSEALRDAMRDTSASPTRNTLVFKADGTMRSTSEIVNRLSRHVSFSSVRGSASIVQISTRSPSDEEARLLANIYAEEYAELTQEAKSNRSETTQEFLSRQFEVRREELLSAEQDLQSYMTREGAVGLDQEGSSLVAQVADLEAQLDNAEIELRLKRDWLKSLQNKLADVSPQLVDRLASGRDHQMQSVQQQIAGLEREREQMLQAYPDEDTRSERTRQQLQQIDERLATLRDEALSQAREYVEAGGADLSGLSSLEQQIEQTEMSIQQLEAQMALMETRLERRREDLRGLPAQSIEVAQLQRTRDYAEQMHKLIAQRLLDARLDSELSKGAGYVRIVREAVRSSPKKADARRNMTLGIFLGLLAGIGLAIVRDKVDNHIYKPDQLREMGYKALAVIPNMQPLIDEDFNGDTFIELDGRTISTSLVALVSPASAISEAYRSVRANLRHSSPVERRVILITSASQGEGKSVSAANMATFLARAGHRTVLLDGDMRRPRIHRLFGVDRTPGLHELLSEDGAFSYEQSRTWVDNLHVIPAGRAYGPMRDPQAARTLSPDELFESRHLEVLIQSLREQFEYVIIDAPPVLAATDAILLSTQADVTVMVVRAGLTREGELEHAMNALREVDAHVAGMLLNGFDVSMGYGYKYRYSNYTKYGYYPKYGYAEDEEKAKVLS